MSRFLTPDNFGFGRTDGGVLIAPPYDFDPAQDELPQNVIFREFTVRITKERPDKMREIEFSYRKKGAVFSGNFSSLADFEDYVKKYGNDRSLPRSRNATHNIRNNSIRRRTLTSIQCGEPVFVVLKVSNNFDWQMSSAGIPISVEGEIVDGQLVASHRDILNARIISDSSEIVDPGTELHGSKYCYFIAKGHQESHFVTPFNIHLDLILNSNNWGLDYLLPIIIDPDIRWPGGSD